MPTINPGTNYRTYPGQTPYNTTMRDFPNLAFSTIAALRSRFMRPRGIDCHYLARMKLGRKHRVAAVSIPVRHSPHARRFTSSSHSGQFVSLNFCHCYNKITGTEYIPNNILIISFYLREIYLIYRRFSLSRSSFDRIFSPF